ncbi:MAG: hypothetical protein ACSW8H_03155 [bacterium]
MKRKICAIVLAGAMAVGLAACQGMGSSSTVSSETKSQKDDSSKDASKGDSSEDSSKGDSSEDTSKTDSSAPETGERTFRGSSLAAYNEVTSVEEKEKIEKALNLANMEDASWELDKVNYAWILSPVTAVLYPEIEDEQGVSVCVPAAYIAGIDTNGDGKADITTSNYEEAVHGSLVINEWGKVASKNGIVYTPSTAPTIFTTGAAGYSSQKNQKASAEYAANGFISVTCGNRGKDSVAKDANGSSYFAGDSPACLVDQKNAIRFVKYNMLLGNLPGNVNYFVTTGGSGGGAFAAMVAATSNNREFFDYEIEAGAVGVYRRRDGGYSTTISVDGANQNLSDGVWGTVAYSPITSLAEGDLALAFENYLDVNYDFGTEFQEALAGNLAEAYADYINRQKLKVSEEALGMDLDGDELLESTIRLTIDYDEVAYSKTRGYGGGYLDLYQRTFVKNLQWMLDNLSYAQGWTWFDANGSRLGDWVTQNMSAQDKALAFLEGRYARDTEKGKKDEIVGTPKGGTTQAAKSAVDSNNYATFAELLSSYEADIAEIKAGDRYGKNQATLYDPLSFIGIQSTENPVWARLVMGATEGDMPLFASLNLQLKWLSVGTDAAIEWQWDGGHVPSEVLGESLELYVDTMYGKYVGQKNAEGETVLVEVAKPASLKQTQNGTATAPTGTKISDWVLHSDLSKVFFSLADAAAYRSKGASKAVPGFDVLDYGQECNVFGNSEKDARHWNERLLEVFQDNELALSSLFGK